MVLVLVIGDCHIPHRAPGLPPKFRTLLVPGRVATALVTGNLCTQVRAWCEGAGGGRGGREWEEGKRRGGGRHSDGRFSPHRPPPRRHPPLFCSQDVYDHLKSVCPDIHAARGDFDDAASVAASRAGDVATVSVGDFSIAVTHGHAAVPWGDPTALDALQRRLGVDILVTGHTHALSVTPTLGGAGLRIDPGSATGAWAPHAPPSPVPSFVLMDVDGGRAVVYMYRLPGGADSDELKVEKLVFEKKGRAGGDPGAPAAPAAAPAAPPAAA